jgi:3-hydroxyacyl-CoA dehydrogenase/enoyl-CoA hydratase/3-hydroxybutyryl-CoA epimerase
MGKVWDVLKAHELELGPLTHQKATAAEAAGTVQPWRHWKIAYDESGIAWLFLDKSGASANTLSDQVFEEFNEALARIEREMPRGLLLRSAKPGGFIAGADIAEFEGMTDPAAAETRLRQAHAIVDRLDRLALPTVAVIHGYCLGGGLELALACDYRIAVDDARLGFPEVMLGLHPGLGGTVRLPRLVNPLQAMSMMLTGRTLRARPCSGN